MSRSYFTTQTDGGTKNVGPPSATMLDAEVLSFPPSVGITRYLMTRVCPGFLGGASNVDESRVEAQERFGARLGFTSPLNGKDDKRDEEESAKDDRDIHALCSRFGAEGESPAPFER